MNKVAIVAIYLPSRHADGRWREAWVGWVVVPVLFAAVCPQPPLLVPEISGTNSVDERTLASLRRACVSAVERMYDRNVAEVVIVGAGPDHGRRYQAETRGTFAAFGRPDVEIGLGRHQALASAPVDVPLSILVGSWILQQVPSDVPRWAVTAGSDDDPATCMRLGRSLDASRERTGLLVMGDGSARRSWHSPAHLHPRGEAYDQIVADGLESADVEVLSCIDPAMSDEVAAAGRPAWQVLAGAGAGRRWSTDLLWSGAPYGVGYFVTTWTL